MTETLILVDADDNPTGFGDKVQCHMGKGTLHRAFTALLFDERQRLLLTRRASTKMLWPDKWDGTVASHPRDGETFVSSAERRLPEELGAVCPLEYLFKFEYHIRDGHRGSENEICGVVMGYIDTSTIHLDPNEISEIRLAEPADIYESDSWDYCPWMLLALAILSRSDIPEGHDVSSWIDAGSHFLEMAKTQIPDHQWRIIP